MLASVSVCCYGWHQCELQKPFFYFGEMGENGGGTSLSRCPLSFRLVLSADKIAS